MSGVRYKKCKDMSWIDTAINECPFGSFVRRFDKINVRVIRYPNLVEVWDLSYMKATVRFITVLLYSKLTRPRGSDIFVGSKSFICTFRSPFPVPIVALSLSSSSFFFSEVDPGMGQVVSETVQYLNRMAV